MGHDPGSRRFDVSGVPISAIDMDGLVAAVARWLDGRCPGEPGAFVCFRDAHGVVRAQDDAALRAAHSVLSLMLVPVPCALT